KNGRTEPSPQHRSLDSATTTRQTKTGPAAYRSSEPFCTGVYRLLLYSAGGCWQTRVFLPTRFVPPSPASMMQTRPPQNTALPPTTTAYGRISFQTLQRREVRNGSLTTRAAN